MPRTLTREEFLKTKIFILTELGHVQTNPTARNWYLNDAMETQTGKIPQVTAEARTKNMKSMTPDMIFKAMEGRINAEKGNRAQIV